MTDKKEMTRQDYQITAWCHRQVLPHIQKGDLCIDATMGNGNDTLFLCQCVGEEGSVIAFDIQQQALDATKQLLEQNMIEKTSYELHLEGHEQMLQYAKEETVSCIMFNLGYLPSGDHALATRADTSISAMEAGLHLLKKNGVMSVCIYSGGDSGFEERDQILAWIRQLDPRKYLVLLTEYYNRPNHPPIPVLIVKL